MSATASGIVDRLVAKGLLARVEDAGDRRVRRIELTADGNHLLSSIDSVFDQLTCRRHPPSRWTTCAIHNGSRAV